MLTVLQKWRSTQAGKSTQLIKKKKEIGSWGLYVAALNI